MMKLSTYLVCLTAAATWSCAPMSSVPSETVITGSKSGSANVPWPKPSQASPNPRPSPTRVPAPSQPPAQQSVAPSSAPASVAPSAATATTTGPATIATNPIPTALLTAKTFAVDDSPARIAFDQAGNVLVSCAGGDVVKLSPDGAPIAKVQGGSRPQDVFVDATGAMWIPSFYDGKVYKVSPDGATTTPFTVGDKPKAVVSDGKGNFLVANGGDGTVMRLSAEGQVLDTFSAGTFPNDMVVDAAGNIWVLEEDAVRKLSPTGEKLAEFALPRAQAITLDRAGTVWVTSERDSIQIINGREGQLIKLSDAAKEVARYDIEGQPAISGLAADADGNLWYANFQGHALKVSPNGRYLAKYKVGKTPYALRIDPSGNVWVANNYGKSVSKIELKP